MWPLFRACKSGFGWELSFCAYYLRQSLGFPFQPMQPLKFLLCPTIEGLVKHEWHRRGAAASFSSNEASWVPRFIEWSLCCYWYDSVVWQTPWRWGMCLCYLSLKQVLQCRIFKNSHVSVTLWWSLEEKIQFWRLTCWCDVLTSNLAGWGDQVLVLIPSIGHDPSERWLLNI